MGDIRKFTIDKYNISKYRDDPRFAVLTMFICCSNQIANDSVFLDESIDKCANSFYGVPIVAKIKESFMGNDFMSHEVELKYDKEIGQYFHYLEENMGFIPESANIRVIPDEKDPYKKWIVADALLWVERNRKAYQIIKKKKQTGISMEVSFDEFDNIDGIDYVKKFTGLAICMLGSTITPAFQTSTAKLNENFSQFKQAFCFALNNDSNNMEVGGNMLNGLTANQLRDHLTEELNIYKYKSGDDEYRRYWVMDYSDNCVYVEDYEDGKKYKISYKFENGKTIFDIDSKTLVEAAFVPVESYSKLKAIYGNKQSKKGEKMNKTIAMSLLPSGYSFVGYSSKAIFATKEGDDKVYAIPYELVEDNIKMSEQVYESELYAQEEIYAKFSVETLSETEKVEGIVLDLPTVTIKDRSVEKFAAFESEKAEMCGKYEAEKSDLTAKYETAVKEKEEVNGKYAELETKYAEISENFAKATENLKEYKDKEFSAEIATVMSEFSLKENDSKTWVEKSKTYSDVNLFKKDLVNYIYEICGEVKKNEKTPITVVSFGLNKNIINPPKNKTNTDPIDSLREKYGING